MAAALNAFAPHISSNSFKNRYADDLFDLLKSCKDKYARTTPVGKPYCIANRPWFCSDLHSRPSAKGTSKMPGVTGVVADASILCGGKFPPSLQHTLKQGIGCPGNNPPEAARR
jgi:hypothetical protein